MVLNDPCGPRYVTDTLGKGPGSLWEASGMPPQPPGEQAGGVRLGSFSAVFCLINLRHVSIMFLSLSRTKLYPLHSFTIKSQKDLVLRTCRIDKSKYEGIN